MSCWERPSWLAFSPKHPSAAKAEGHFTAFFGTIEIVPFQNAAMNAGEFFDRRDEGKFGGKIEAGRQLREWKDFPKRPARWTLNRVWVVLLV